MVASLKSLRALLKFSQKQLMFGGMLLLASGSQAIGQVAVPGIDLNGLSGTGTTSTFYGVEQPIDLASKQADLDRKLIDQQLARIRNDRAAIRNGALRMENGWMARELLEFHKLQNVLSQLLSESRQRKAAFETQRGELMKFLNGQTTALSHAKFRKSIQQLEQTPEIKELLLQHVSEIPASDFSRPFEQFTALNRDGSLTKAPHVRGENKTVSIHPAKFEDCWREAVESVIAGRSMTSDQLDGLHVTWQRARSSAVSAAATRADEVRVGMYFNSLKRLIDALNDPRQTKQLRDYLDPEAFAYAGGTVANLIQHIAENRLSVRYGSPAQLALSELGHDLMRDLDGQIASLTTRVEELKAQNPAHNAALKQRVIANAQVNDSEFNTLQIPSNNGLTNSGFAGGGYFGGAANSASLTASTLDPGMGSDGPDSNGPAELPDSTDAEISQPDEPTVAPAMPRTASPVGFNAVPKLRTTVKNPPKPVVTKPLAPIEIQRRLTTSSARLPFLNPAVVNRNIGRIP